MIDFLNQIIAPLIVGVVLLLLEHRLNDRRQSLQLPSTHTPVVHDLSQRVKKIAVSRTGETAIVM
ncbi:hypothetical protein [Lacticaseibacillus paracasei]|uniref:hypothetical protein n=1 Tax=Lacticaseibacillus paracasei TaxID=1597 RepID=UPI0021D22393|nr:hypothetical protein [Lacticaseibacillus paracasei]MCU6429748.1 hypothetical protein [Lacticaseibacillus paracasei]